jgi:hypothetical protein
MDRLRYGFLALSFLMLLFGIFRGMSWLLLKLETSPILIPLLPDMILDLFLLSTGGISLISNLASVLGILFFAEDLELILASPISGLRFFLGRFLRVWIQCSWMPILFSIPIILAIGAHYNSPVIFYIAAAIFIPAALVIPTIIASFIAIPFAHTLPRLAIKGTKVLLAGFAIILLAILAIVAPSILDQTIATNRIWKILYYITLPDTRFFPIRWVTSLLSSLALGGGELGVLSDLNLHYTILIFSLLGVGISASFFLYAVFYPQTYALTKTASNVSETTLSISSIVDWMLPKVAPQSRAILTAEFGSLFREWSSLFEMGLLVVLGSVYLGNIRLVEYQNEIIGGSAGSEAKTFFLINILLATFFGIACATRLIFPSISRDGRAGWMLYTGPISTSQVILTKFRVWSVFLGVLMGSFLAISSFVTTGSLLQTALSTLFGGIISYGCSAIAIGIGARYANFSWEHITQLSGSLGSLLCMIANIIYAGFSAMIFVEVVYSNLVVSTAISTLNGVLETGVTLLLLALLTAIIKRNALAIGCKALERDLR